MKTALISLQKIKLYKRGKPNHRTDEINSKSKENRKPKIHPFHENSWQTNKFCKKDN